jgi:hypothetical protein
MPSSLDDLYKPRELGPETPKVEPFLGIERGTGLQEEWGMVRARGRHRLQITIRIECIPLVYR